MEPADALLFLVLIGVAGTVAVLIASSLVDDLRKFVDQINEHYGQQIADLKAQIEKLVPAGHGPDVSPAAMNAKLNELEDLVIHYLIRQEQERGRNHRQPGHGRQRRQADGRNNATAKTE